MTVPGSPVGRRFGVPVALSKACIAGLLATAGGLFAAAGLAAAWGSRSLATAAGTVAVVMGSTAFAATALGSLPLRRRWRGILILLLVPLTAAVTVLGMGTKDLTTMEIGLQASCRLGLGRCLPTGVPSMPVLVKLGPVQHRPVVRLVIWGADQADVRSAKREESDAAGLGQPLLRRWYGVEPAVDGGSWTVPVSPTSWMRARRESALTPADLRSLVGMARAARGWPATADTQWWLVMGLTTRQSGMSSAGCADHLRIGGLAGVVVRVPVGSCPLPAARVRPATQKACSPVSAVRPHTVLPDTARAGLDLLIDHEFVEAATDPRSGWQVLVAPVCRDISMFEIADVCAVDGSVISAPDWATGAGWQPSVLEPPTRRRPSRCVNPARPGG